MAWQVYADPRLSCLYRSGPSLQINTAGFGVLNRISQTTLAQGRTHVEVYCTRDRSRLAVKFIAGERPWALRLVWTGRNRALTFSLKSILRETGLEGLKGKRFVLVTDGGMHELRPLEDPEAGPRASWVLWSRRVRGRFKDRPILRISPDRLAKFNRLALRRFSAGRRHVELYFDPDARRAALRFVPGPTPDAYSLVLSAKEAASAFSIYPFLARTGLTEWIGRYFLLVEKGDLLVLEPLE